MFNCCEYKFIKANLQNIFVKNEVIYVNIQLLWLPTSFMASEKYIVIYSTQYTSTFSELCQWFWPVQCQFLNEIRQFLLTQKQTRFMEVTIAEQAYFYDK